MFSSKKNLNKQKNNPRVLLRPGMVADFGAAVLGLFTWTTSHTYKPKNSCVLEFLRSKVQFCS